METSDFKIYSSSQETWEAMYLSILEAQKSIYWELYVFVDDEAGKPFFDVLEQKAKVGVDVKLVIDSLGSFWLSRKRVDSLKKSGVDIRFFYENKNPYRGWWRRMWTRSHRKVLVIDEKVGFVGGVNIRKSMQDWYDIHLRMEGKVIHSLLRAFAKSYIICGGDAKNVKQLLKYKFRIKSNEAEIVADEPSNERSSARDVYTEAFLKARERVIIFSPYYFPDKKFLYGLWQARKRGVKIDLLIPFRADIKVSTYASYIWFSLMNKLGVDIHFTEKMFHGKGLIVDDDWAMVGSSNIESTSFYDNYELNIKIKQKDAVRKIKEAILKRLDAGKIFQKEMWDKRGWQRKVKEWLAGKLYYLWHGKH